MTPHHGKSSFSLPHSIGTRLRLRPKANKQPRQNISPLRCDLSDRFHFAGGFSFGQIMKTISLHEYLEIIKERPLFYVSGFTLFSKKCTHQCQICDTQWLATPSNIRMGRGCPECARIRRNTSKELSEIDVRSKLASSGIDYVEGYCGVFNEIDVICQRSQHQWRTKTCNVLYGNGCPKCARRTLTVEDHISAISGRNIAYVSGYTKMHSPCLHRCEKGHEWSATPSNIQRGTSCPACSATGFNPGKDATLYVLRSEHGHIKIGITGPNKNRRFQNLRYSTPFPFVVSHQINMNGTDAQKSEKFLHKQLKDHSSGFTGFDACTEWFIENDVTLKLVSDFIKEKC